MSKSIIEKTITAASKMYFKIEEKEEELKVTSAQIRAEIKDLRKSMRKRLDMVNKKAETLSVECLAVYNYDREIVTVIRQDTGEIVEDRPMKDNERQQELPFNPGGANAGSKAEGAA
ncbi:MAG: hypothetical protein JRI85_17695 [Deltaproteobacteria bacterium]|nr:hypothetical protein [Deltaproteobacteria bacterium]